MKRISFMLIVAVLFAYANPVNAKKKKNSIGVTTAQTLVGKNNVFIFPEEFKLDQFGVSYEYYMNSKFSLGLEYNTFFNKEVKDLRLKEYKWRTFNTNLVLTYYTNNGYTFSEDAVITPYFSLGLAYYRVHKDNENPKFYTFSNNTISGLGRVGLNLQWSKYVSTQVYLQRARVIPYYNADDKEFVKSKNSLHTIGATLKFHFGGSDKPRKTVVENQVTLDEYANQHPVEQAADTTFNADSLIVNDNLIVEDNLIENNTVVDTVAPVKKSVKPVKKVVPIEDTPRKIRIYNNDGKLNIYIDKGRALDIQIDNGSPREYKKNPHKRKRQCCKDKKNRIEQPCKKEVCEKKKQSVKIVPVINKDTVQKLDTAQRVGVIEKIDTTQRAVSVHKVDTIQRIDTVQTVKTIHKIDTVTVVKPIKQIVRDTVWVKEPVVKRDTIYINNAPIAKVPQQTLRENDEKKVQNSSQSLVSNKRDTIYSVKEIHHYKDEVKQPVQPAKKDTVFIVKEVNNNTKEIHHYKDSDKNEKKEKQEVKSNLPKVQPAKKDTIIINNIINPAVQQPKIIIKEVRDTVRLVKRDTVHLVKKETVIQKDTITVKEKVEAPADKIRRIYFKNGQNKLTAENKNDLVSFVQTLEQSSVIFIEGYTDKSGSTRLNERISKNRAENVKKYLVTLGISADKMWVKGYGDKFATKKNDPQERLVLIRAKQ